MYHSMSGCSTFVYLLAKHPILIVALGLVGAITFLRNPSGTALPPVSSIESAEQEMADSPVLGQRTAYASAAYESIVAVESSLSVKASAIPEAELYFNGIVDANGRHIRGVHRDRVSYGPAGLTRDAVRDLLRKIPDCTIMTVQGVLLTPDENLKLGYLYFLDLVHRFSDVEVSVIAYNNGPSKVARLLRHGKPLPQGYLMKVKKHIHQ